MEFSNSRIVGIDLVPEFVADAKERAEEVYIADAHALPFKDGEFDWIFSSHTFEHLPDPAKAAREMERVAKFGIFLVAPLETTKHFQDNLSHENYSLNPVFWLSFFSGQDWLVSYSQITEKGDNIATIIKAEYIFKSEFLAEGVKQ